MWRLALSVAPVVKANSRDLNCQLPTGSTSFLQTSPGGARWLMVVRFSCNWAFRNSPVPSAKAISNSCLRPALATCGALSRCGKKYAALAVDCGASRERGLGSGRG